MGETKPSLYTSEFWVTLIAYVGGILNLTGVWDFAPNSWTTIAMAILTGFYTVGRGAAKSSNAPNPAVPPQFFAKPQTKTEAQETVEANK